MVLNDFLRGKIPWFTPPPVVEGEVVGKGVEGREGRLGEMGKKRKREDDDAADSTALSESVVADDTAAPLGTDNTEDFEGFEDESGGVGVLSPKVSSEGGTDASDSASSSQQQESLAIIEEG